MILLLLVFSSPDPKAQVIYSDCLLHVVRPRSSDLSVCKLFTFSSSPREPLGQFQANWVQAFVGEEDSSLFK